jgi:hypothetical protein
VSFIIACGCHVAWLACSECHYCLFCCLCGPMQTVERVGIPLRHIHGVDSWKPGAMNA